MPKADPNGKKKEEDKFAATTSGKKSMTAYMVDFYWHRRRKLLDFYTPKQNILLSLQNIVTLRI